MLTTMIAAIAIYLSAFVRPRKPNDLDCVIRNVVVPVGTWVCHPLYLIPMVLAIAVWFVLLAVDSRFSEPQYMALAGFLMSKTFIVLCLLMRDDHSESEEMISGKIHVIKWCLEHASGITRLKNKVVFNSGDSDTEASIDLTMARHLATLLAASEFSSRANALPSLHDEPDIDHSHYDHSNTINVGNTGN